MNYHEKDNDEGSRRLLYGFFLNHCLPSKAIMSVRCKGLVRLKESKKTLLNRKDNKNQGSLGTDDVDLNL